MSYNLIIVPEGSSIPEDLQHLVFQGDDIIQKISAGAASAVIVSVNTRELQMLVEYRDLFDAEPIAIIGMQGAMYNTVWNTYVATMERTTLDSLRAKLREDNEAGARAGSELISRPDRSARLARLVEPQRRRDNIDAENESDYSPDA